MLRQRVITVLTFNDGVLFRTKLFKPDYRYTLNFVDAWSVDEIVVLDVTRPGAGRRESFYEVVRTFSDRCFVPLAAGGGIRTLNDVAQMMRIGADKVVINSAALERPEFITEIAERHGSQCVVVSIDARPDEDGEYRVYGRFAQERSEWRAQDWAREAQRRGAGEVLVCAIERDGWLQGYDIELCSRVADAVDVPVLILGGCGNWRHMAEGLGDGRAAAVCTQNIYHFTEQSIKSAKSFLHQQGLNVRV